MRRVLGFVLMVSVLRLTAFDVLTECERHAEASALGTAEMSDAGHEHHAATSPTSEAAPGTPSPQSGDPEGESLPKCCVVTSTCAGSTLAAGVVSRVADRDAAAAKWVPAPSAPRTVVDSPEPPPPKA